MGPLTLLVRGVQTVLVTLVLYLGIQTFVAQPFRVEQGSMLDTLREGQYVLIDKLTPGLTGYERGDIVVFRPRAVPGDIDDTPYIKRIIGVAGDTVEIRNGGVWVDGARLDEPYVYGDDGTYPFSARVTSWEVPEGALFVLGDHRSDSADSRSDRIGLVPLENAIGRAFLRYWPLPALSVLESPTYANER